MNSKTELLYAELDCVQTEMGETEQTIEDITIETERKGIVVFKFIRCGKQHCHCGKGGRPHGPYPHLQWWENGKIKTKYLNKKNYPIIVEELSQCKEVKVLTKKLAALKKKERQLLLSLKKMTAETT